MERFFFPHIIVINDRFVTTYFQYIMQQFAFQFSSLEFEFNFICVWYHSNGTFISTQKKKIIISLSLVVRNSVEPKFWNLMVIFHQFVKFRNWFWIALWFSCVLFFKCPLILNFYIHNLWMQHVHLNIVTLAHQCSEILLFICLPNATIWCKFQSSNYFVWSLGCSISIKY